jgi:hypothetical protein
MKTGGNPSNPGAMVASFVAGTETAKTTRPSRPSNRPLKEADKKNTRRSSGSIGDMD